MIAEAVANKAAQTAAGYEAAFAPDMTLYWWEVTFSVFFVGFAVFCGFKAWTRYSRAALWLLFGFLLADLIWGVWATIDGKFGGIAIVPAGIATVSCMGALRTAHKLHRQVSTSASLHQAPIEPPMPETWRSFETQPSPPLARTGHSLSSQDIERISQLSALHEAGKLTDAEFSRQKELILKGM